jgi:putative transposase
MARSRYRFAEHDRPHFLTCTVVEWLPVFTRQAAAQVLFDAWTHQQAHAGLRLYGFVVLENHLHAVAQAPDLPKTWGGLALVTPLQRCHASAGAPRPAARVHAID